MIYICALCRQPFALIPLEEMPEHRRLVTEAMGSPPRCTDDTHPHLRCLTPACAALMPPGWCMCLHNLETIALELEDDEEDLEPDVHDTDPAPPPMVDDE